MDTDSDSDEDCLIPARLLNLKNNSQAPFTHSQRGKCTSSSQHDSQRQILRSTPTETGLTSSGRRELGVSAHHVPAHTARNTCRVPSSHTARRAPHAETQHRDGPFTLLGSSTQPQTARQAHGRDTPLFDFSSQHRETQRRHSPFQSSTQHRETPARLLGSSSVRPQLVSVSSPDEPVMLSLCGKKGRQGQRDVARTGTTVSKALSYEDTAVPETSGVETISETDFSEEEQGEGRETPVKNVPKSAVFKTPGAGIPLSASEWPALSQSNASVTQTSTLSASGATASVSKVPAPVSSVPASHPTSMNSNAASKPEHSTGRSATKHSEPRYIYKLLDSTPVRSSSEYNIGAVWQTVSFESDDEDDDDDEEVTVVEIDEDRGSSAECKPSSDSKPATTCSRVPSIPSPSADREEDEEGDLVLPTVSFQSKHRQNSQRQTGMAGGGVCASSSSSSSQTAQRDVCALPSSSQTTQRQSETSSRWPGNECHSWDASSSDADIESVGSASDTEPATAPRSVSKGSRKKTHRPPPVSQSTAHHSDVEPSGNARPAHTHRPGRAMDTETRQLSAGHRGECTVTYEDPTQEYPHMSPVVIDTDPELSPSILQQETQDMQGSGTPSGRPDFVEKRSQGTKQASYGAEAVRNAESTAHAVLEPSVSHTVSQDRTSSSVSRNVSHHSSSNSVSHHSTGSASTVDLACKRLTSQTSLDSDMTQPYEASDTESQEAPPTLHSLPSIPSMLQRQVSGQSLPPPQLTRRSSSAISDSGQSTQPPSLTRQSSSVIADSAGSTVDGSTWSALTAAALGQVKREREERGGNFATSPATASSSDTHDSPVYSIKREAGFPQRGFRVTVPIAGITEHSHMSAGTERGGGCPAAESLTISVSLPTPQGLTTQPVKREAEREGAMLSSSSLLPKKEEKVDAERSCTVQNASQYEDDGDSDQSQCLFEDLPAPQLSQADEKLLSDAEEGVIGAPGAGTHMTLHMSTPQPSMSDLQFSLCPSGPQVVVKQEGSSGAGGEDGTEADFVGYTVEDDQVVVFDSDEEEMFTSFTQVEVKNEAPSDTEGDEGGNPWADIWDTQPIEILSDEDSDDDERSGDSGVALSKDGEVKIREVKACGKNSDSDGDIAMDSADDDDLLAASGDFDVKQDEKAEANQKQDEKMAAEGKLSIFSQLTLEDEAVDEVADGGDLDSVFFKDTQVDSLLMTTDDHDDHDDGNSKQKDSPRPNQSESEDEKDVKTEDFDDAMDDDMDDALYMAATQIDEEAPVTKPSLKSHCPPPLKQKSSTSKDSSHTHKPSLALSKQTSGQSVQSSEGGMEKLTAGKGQGDKGQAGKQVDRRVVSDILHPKPAFLQTMDSISHRPRSKPASPVVDLTQDSSDDNISVVSLSSTPEVKVKEQVTMSEGETSKDKSKASMEDVDKAKVDGLFDCATLAEEDHFSGLDSDADAVEIGAEEQSELRRSTSSEQKRLYDAQTLAEDNVLSDEQDEETEVDIYSMATQRDFDPYLAATQLDPCSPSDSDDDHSEDQADTRGEKRKHSSESDVKSDTDAATPPRAEVVADKDSDLELISDSDFDLEEEKETEKQDEICVSDPDDTPSNQSLGPRGKAASKSSCLLSSKKSFADARETMKKIKERNMFVGAMEISPQAEKRRRGKRLGLKQKLCEGEGPVPRRELVQQHSLTTSHVDPPYTAASAPPKGILRSASTDQPGPRDQRAASTSSDPAWLSKQPNLVVPKPKLSKPSKPKSSKPSEPKRSRKQGKGPATPDLSDITKKARQAMQERLMKAIEHPELTLTSRPKEVIPQCDLDTDVELPDTQQVFGMGLPLMTNVVPVSKERLTKARARGNQQPSASSATCSRPSQESDETTGSVSTSERTSTQTDGKQDKTPGRPSKESSQQHSTKIQADAGKGEKTVQQEKPSKSDARRHSAAGSAKPQGKPGQDSGHRHKRHGDAPSGDKDRAQPAKTSSSASTSSSTDSKEEKAKSRSRNSSDDSKRERSLSQAKNSSTASKQDKSSSHSGSSFTDSREEKSSRQKHRSSLDSKHGDRSKPEGQSSKQGDRSKPEGQSLKQGDRSKPEGQSSRLGDRSKPEGQSTRSKPEGQSSKQDTRSKPDGRSRRSRSPSLESISSTSSSDYLDAAKSASRRHEAASAAKRENIFDQLRAEISSEGNDSEGTFSSGMGTSQRHKERRDTGRSSSKSAISGSLFEKLSCTVSDKAGSASSHDKLNDRAIPTVPTLPTPSDRSVDSGRTAKPASVKSNPVAASTRERHSSGTVRTTDSSEHDDGERTRRSDDVHSELSDTGRSRPNDVVLSVVPRSGERQDAERRKSGEREGSSRRGDGREKDSEHSKRRKTGSSRRGDGREKDSEHSKRRKTAEGRQDDKKHSKERRKSKENERQREDRESSKGNRKHKHHQHKGKEQKNKESEQTKHKESEQTKHKESEKTKHKESEKTKDKESEQTKDKESEQTKHKESDLQKHKESDQTKHKESDQTKHKESDQPKHKESDQTKHKESEQRKNKEHGEPSKDKTHKDSSHKEENKRHTHSEDRLQKGGKDSESERVRRKRRHSSGSSSASPSSKQAKTDAALSSSTHTVPDQHQQSHTPSPQLGPISEQGAPPKGAFVLATSSSRQEKAVRVSVERQAAEAASTSRGTAQRGQASVTTASRSSSEVVSTVSEVVCTEPGDTVSVKDRARPPTPPRRSEISPRGEGEEESGRDDQMVPVRSGPAGKKTVRFNLTPEYRCVSPLPPHRPNVPLDQTLPTLQEMLSSKNTAAGKKAPHFVGNPLQKRLAPLQELKLQQQQHQQQQQQLQSTIPEFVFKPLVLESNQASGSGENVAPGKSLLGPHDLLIHLLRWSPHWLIEYEKQVQRAGERGGGGELTPPPVVDLSQLYPLLTTYGDKIEEYQQICFKLLLLETWEDVFRSWKEKKQKVAPWQVVLAQTYRPSSQVLITFEWTGVVTEREWRSGHYPMEGDLLALNMVGFNLPPSRPQPSQHAPQPAQGRQVQSQVLACVERSRVVKCQDVRRLLNQNEALRKHPAVVSEERNLYELTVKVNTRYRKFAPTNKALVTLEALGSLTPTLRRFSALQMLPRCPLMRDVLSPSLAASGRGVDIPRALMGRSKLNEDQSVAVRTMLSAVHQPPSTPRLSLLQGPPGTGKSHVIIATILRILQVKPKAKICLAAPSNAAADELLRRLIIKKNTVGLNFDMVRIGKVGSTHSDVKQLALENKVQTAKELVLREKRMKMVPETVRTEHTRLENKIVAMEDRLFQLRHQRKMAEAEVLEREMKKEQRRKDVLTKQIQQGNQDQYVNQSVELTGREYNEIFERQLKEPQIVCGTLSSFGQPRILDTLRRNPTGNRYNNQHFTCAIIDEATQATELDSLIPLQYCVTKLFMVGDPNQLPPTVLSTKAQSLNYNLSLFERLYNHFHDRPGSDNPVMMLRTQYRMDPAICRFPNRHVYRDLLVTDRQVLENCAKYPLHPYVIFDVEEGQELLSQSGTLSNELEADCTAVLCHQLLNTKLHITPNSIGIICPYAGQKRLVTRKLKDRNIEGIEVNTVDGFQGREKHIIILSCVRARSSTGGIGFMADTRRMNVALTRAKYALYIIAHLQSLRTDRDWKALVMDAQDRGQRPVIQRVHNLTEFPDLVRHCCFKHKYRP
ncbi:uncharacterized protein [Littorina saxatilis]|uniref:uncharacterized protein n=1 Tax=Littorina saxatilis TaxID=31220 RepID=UPI0038B4A6F3